MKSGKYLRKQIKHLQQTTVWLISQCQLSKFTQLLVGINTWSWKQALNDSVALLRSCQTGICWEIGWWCQICIWSQASFKCGGSIPCIVCLSLLDRLAFWNSGLNWFKRTSMSISWEAKKLLMCSFHNYFKKHVIFAICVENHHNRMCDLDHIPVFTKG